LEFDQVEEGAEALPAPADEDGVADEVKGLIASKCSGLAITGAWL